jgi:serine phosphatase RsbU (regulator of sigma subunit)/anti-sigma regulatory factor (Ser/Thr protein kinase)
MAMTLKRLRRRPEEPELEARHEQASNEVTEAPVVEIPEHDPFHTYLLQIGGPVEPARVQLDSPALTALRSAGVALVVPLISHGELIGTLNLGPRLSDQPYSTDDRRLLAGLAAQVAPAIQVAQLVRRQEEEAKERERIDQELRVAALIQQTLLPKELPPLGGWTIDAYYRAARQVGGDFYDFIPRPGGLIGLVVGDVTDKGVPAALVMATCRSILRAAAAQHDDPGQVLRAVNEALVPEIPQGMFVTCFYGILDPATGELHFANAGHNLPYVHTASGVVELRATGMPLGLMPGMNYDVVTATVGHGETMLLSSDGIVEAHAPDGEMFGFPRLMGLVGGHAGGSQLIDAVLREFDRFTAGAEQEDDVTMVTIRRTAAASAGSGGADPEREPGAELISSFTVPSEEGNERLVVDRVNEVIAGLGLTADRQRRLETAVAEAAMNAIEHGNQGLADRPVEVKVLASPESIVVQVRDQGGGREIEPPEAPDLEAKLAGEQPPRGWGLFLIENMVDRMQVHTDSTHHTLALEMRLKEASDATN